MDRFEPFVPLRAIAERSMGSTSYRELLAACRRDGAHHPLPHLESGERRKVYRARFSDYERWVAEEAELNAR